ncbi:MAG: outer membrane lipoprotein carrier protein LolA [Firmicutes bacterium]|nr:outer membrane lipoprotein carrier protein LolA [Bacillota bacterium]
MKKKIILLWVMICFLITGCFGNGSTDVVKNLNKKYDNLKSYKITGDLEILNNDDIYNYNVKVIYQKNDKYYVSLKNKSNNHEQIILKNESGVYVLTPSLNKSFKFQSDWPYNNSQVYLINSILNDITEDEERQIEEDENYYTITTKVNYPNNRRLVNQKVKLDKDFNLKEVKVVDENGTEQMKMNFNTIETNQSVDNNTFNLDSIMESNQTINEENTTTSSETNALEDTIYPLYIPTGTVLVSEEKVEKTNGERIIMTFEGEKPFLLVEETSSIEEEFSIIPTYGEPYLLIDTVGALTESSISWSSNGVDYYIVSDVMSQDELVDIARSVNVVPNSK